MIIVFLGAATNQLKWYSIDTLLVRSNDEALYSLILGYQEGLLEFSMGSLQAKLDTLMQVKTRVEGLFASDTMKKALMELKRWVRAPRPYFSRHAVQYQQV